MRSSYYSDRRFKRGSLAHELYSKIEVTTAQGEERGIYLHDPISFSSSPPCPSSSLASSPFSAPRLFLLVPSSVSLSPPSLIRGRLTLLLFRRYIFSSHRKRILLPRPLSLPLSLTPFLCSLSDASILAAARRATAESSSRDFVDYNKCVCSSRGYGSSSSVPLFYFSSSTSFSPLPLIIVLCCHPGLPIRPFGRTPSPQPPTTTTA